MRMYALVYTTLDAPDTPKLEEAWDSEVYGTDPSIANQQLSDLVGEGHNARVVTVDVPDEALLWRLNDEPNPIAGTVDGWRG